MGSRADFGIGVVTALAVECAAMRTVIDEITNVPSLPGDPNRYVAGTMPSSVEGAPHRVVLTVMARDNNKNSAAVCVDLLRSFPEMRCVLMVGIAGGIPAPEVPQRHVRLGDVVVATEGVVDYDHVRNVDGEQTIRRHLQGLSTHMTRAAQEVRVGEHLGRRPWEETLRTAAPRFTRPPASTDVLRAGGRVVGHPDPELSGHSHGFPKIHYAAIASADRLLRDEAYRDRLVRRHGDVSAVEMEGSGIATASDLHEAHWFVVRGVADYCDTSKNAIWQPYAAMTAAAYARALLAHAPPFASARRARSGDRGAVVALLMAVPAMGEGQTRQLIVERLRPEIRGAIRRFPAARPDVYEILSTCLDYEGGKGELIEAIRFAAGDALSARLAIEALEGL